MKKVFTFIFCFAFVVLLSKANNVQTSNIFLTGQNVASDFSLINFNISWENSWRTSTNEMNFDGAWIFVKFRKANSNNWQHATINYLAPGDAAACGHVQPSGSTIKTPSDGKGAFIYRSGNGNGTVNFTGARLRWNYGVDGVLDADSVEIRLFAVEMVYCPQGSFYLGSGGTEYYYFRDGAVDTYYPITSENAITCGNAAGNLYSSQGGNWFTGTLPAAFPKGFNAVWCMKYEVSQQQYVDFLNTIDYNKYIARNPYSGAYTTGTHPNLSATEPERAMGYISCLDLFALLDWSGLRPFTEFEYEKICRGNNQVPVANEYPWGNTTIDALSGVTNQGTSTEVWGAGNCNFTGAAGALIRCGSLATSTTNRVQSGATYYGVMEMGGNVWEWAVSGYETSGRAYTGLHGDGNLSANGDYNVTNWPAGGTGLAIRGGAYASASGQCQTSDRIYGSYYYISKASVNYGGRGCRTAE